jgi:transposase
MLLVGIDWADDHHDICLVDPDTQDSESCLDAFRIAQSVDGFEKLHAKLREFSALWASPDQVHVAIETPHGLLVHELIRHGYCVYAINPKAVNRYKDRHSPAAPKDDARDALALGHILRTDRTRHSPLAMLPDDYRLLDEICKDLRQMIDDKTRILNRLTSCLKEYYPQALELFSRLDSQVAMALLKKYPTPGQLRALSKKQFLAFLTRQNYSRPSRAEALYATATAATPTADSVLERSGCMRMLVLLDQLATLQSHVKDYERQIKALFAKLPESDHVANLPGVGGRVGPELVATLGPRPDGQSQQFASVEALERLAGAVPVTKQSGRYKHVVFRRACDRRLRRTLHDWAQSSLSVCCWARAYYDHYKAQGHKHNTLLRNLACKLLNILHRLWRTGEVYNEQLHIDNLKARNVSWATAL